MNMLRWTALIATLLLIISSKNDAHASKILGLFPSQSKSHLIVQFAIVRALVERGHNVTVITTIPYKEPNLTGIKHLVLKTDYSFEHAVIQIVKSKGTWSKIKNTFSAVGSLMEASSNITQKDEFQKIMNEESFDLVLLGYIFNEYHLGLGAHFKCPTAVVWVQKPFYALDRMIGNPFFALDFSRLQQMAINNDIENGFLFRLTNFLLALFEQAYMLVYDYVQESYYVKNFPPEKYPSFQEALQDISLLLVNHHFSEKFVRAIVPAFVEIGGIQIKSTPDPLPDDIKQFLDSSAQHGAILFSLGSNIKSKHVDSKAMKNIFKVLSKLKQNIIWKWEDGDKPGNSSNIIYKNWLPQDDILAHPNLRLFISHGGKGSMVETSYHGVPIIGIPIFGDQPGNVYEMVTKGFGVSIDLDKLTEEMFEAAVNEVLTNETYTKNVKTYSSIYRDRPMSAKESAIYWIEYIIRHKGAKHMQSSAVYLNKFQLLSLDVIGFLLVILYVFYRIVKMMFRFVFRKCCASKKGIKRQKSKTD